MKFFKITRTPCGNQVSCYGLGFIGFLAPVGEINNKFNRHSNILHVSKNDGGNDVDIVLGDYVDVNTLFDYIKRFCFSTDVTIAFFGAKLNQRKERPFLMGCDLKK